MLLCTLCQCDGLNSERRNIYINKTDICVCTCILLTSVMASDSQITHGKSAITREVLALSQEVR